MFHFRVAKLLPERSNQEYFKHFGNFPSLILGFVFNFCTLCVKSSPLICWKFFATQVNTVYGIMNMPMLTQYSQKANNKMPHHQYIGFQLPNSHKTTRHSLYSLHCGHVGRIKTQSERLLRSVLKWQGEIHSVDTTRTVLKTKSTLNYSALFASRF